MDINLLLRILTVSLLVARFVYWIVTEFTSHKQKPKLQKISARSLIERVVVTSLGGFMLLQILGLPILPYDYSIPLQILGFILVVISVIVGVLGRKELGSNWAHAAEYQIKKDHELVDTGIYSYIRHPIYLGVMLTAIGGQLVAGSYIGYLFLLLTPILAYTQGVREEKLLTEHFGKRYLDYMRKTKRFIPYIW